MSAILLFPHFWKKKMGNLWSAEAPKSSELGTELVASVLPLGKVRMQRTTWWPISFSPLQSFHVEFLLESGLVCSAPLALEEKAWRQLAQALEAGGAWQPLTQDNCWLELTAAQIVIHALATTYLPTPLYGPALAGEIHAQLDSAAEEPLQFPFEEPAPPIVVEDDEEMPSLIDSECEDTEDSVDQVQGDSDEMPDLV